MAEMTFMLCVTARFRANGFNFALCSRNRSLVASVTSALASTRASGV
jgi:hypothetical protein